LKLGIERGGELDLVKVNQIGTLTETLEAMKMAADGIRRWFRTGRVKPRTHLSLTWLSPQGIKTDRPAARTASPNTINCCASKRISGRPRDMRAVRPFGNDVGPATGPDDSGWLGLLARD
jgi:hypothetical protein